MSKAFRLGVFIVLALLVFAGAVFLIGSRQFLFSSTYRLNAEFQNVAGLSEGSEVRVGGLREGTVKRIDLPTRPDGKVRVVMDLQHASQSVIKRDSVAVISAEGLVGDKYVEVSFGSNQAASVNDGDTIASRAPVDVSDVVRKADAILETAKGAVESLDETAGNLKSISSKVDQGKGTVGALINDRTIYQHVNQGATEFQEDMEALKHNFLTRGFFKKRGYEDSTALTRYEIPALPSASPGKKLAYDANKIFDKPDTARLKNAKTLNAAGKLLEQTSFRLAVIAVHAGMKGDSEKDLVLAKARAMVVRDYLVQNFKFDDTRLKTLGLGKTNEDEAGVEVLIYAPEAADSASRAQARR
jgi:phospholipid/cholesterol/gamma-HCH transport system substrate-binding protein